MKSVRLSMRMLTAVCAAVLAVAARAAEPPGIHVYMQPMARALPFFVGIDKGFFDRRGLLVEVHFTRSSKEQMNGLENGTAEIVYSAVDNAVAMVEVAKKDVVIVSGGDSGTNEFYVQGYVKDFADIRGHAIAVDQSNTAYALQAKKILLKHGQAGRLHAQSGRQRGAAIEEPGAGQEQRQRDPEPAVFAASRGGRHA